MTIMTITNPFNAPVYHEETVTSTMDVSRELAARGEPHGTVITADFQREGRGRIRGRVWQQESKLNLPFTILLRYSGLENIPQVLTLRAGLAVSLAIEDFSLILKGRVKVKWPNDIMVDEKKAAGILCEADGETGYIGIGTNVAQKNFPAELQKKATSIAIASGADLSAEDRFNLLEKNLFRLYNELNIDNTDWKPRLEQRLFKKDDQALFIEGAAGSGNEVKGRLVGINENGELLIESNGELRKFITGELAICSSCGSW